MFEAPLPDLRAQNRAVETRSEARRGLDRMVELAISLKLELEAGRLDAFGDICRRGP